MVLSCTSTLFIKYLISQTQQEYFPLQIIVFDFGFVSMSSNYEVARIITWDIHIQCQVVLLTIMVKTYVNELQMVYYI